jgi:cytochrome c-type biogenesis protein CcmE
MKRKNGTVKWIVGACIIAGVVIGMSFLSLNDNLVYFYTTGEATAQAETLATKNIKVGGMVKPGSVQWEPEKLALNFVITDLKEHEIVVNHRGTPPDMFKENQGVVVEGKIDPTGKSMTSKHLMVKHSEEYKKPGDHSTMDKALLERSIFKE